MWEGEEGGGGGDLHAKSIVLVTTANLPEFRRRRKLDDVLTTLRMPRRFARENFTSGRRFRPISSSMFKVPNVTTATAQSFVRRRRNALN